MRFHCNGYTPISHRLVAELCETGPKIDNHLMRSVRPGNAHLSLICALLLASSLAFAAKDFVLPRPNHVSAYPARDEHPTEQVGIAADPYDSSEKASLFVNRYRDNGYLPLFFVISNDGDQPVELASMKVQLVTGNRSKIQPATDEDLYRRFSQVKHRGDEPSRNPLPVPLPRKGPDMGISKEARQEIDTALFHARAVEPHASQAGFLFFDIKGISQPLAGAHLYVTGIRDGKGQELMYFEIPLDKYLNRSSAQSK
jgi:hypothetical protein